MSRLEVTAAAERRAAADPSRCTPHHWPFAPLTESQIRARLRFEAALRAGTLALPSLSTVEQMAWRRPQGASL